MRLGVMQPYFFPYIGYFQLIKACDKFVFFDTPQYERRSWMNRNRIINIKESSTYITVPTIRAPQQTSFRNIKISNSQNWQQTILAQLEIYRKRAPFYNAVIDLVRAVVFDANDSLVELDINSIVRACEYLGVTIDFEVFSKMELIIPECCEPDEWALNITKEMGYNSYVNAPGGMEFFSSSKYSGEGINLQFLQPQITEYNQKIGRFEPALSIIDVMMFNSKEEILNMLDNYKLVDPVT